MLTLKDFEEIPDGEIFATGRQPNSVEGIFMTSNGGNLHWVAKKGFGDDWCIYCHWDHFSTDYIAKHGDKVTAKHHIKKCVPCEDKVFSKYRY